MGNQVTGKVDFEVDGKTFCLHYTPNGMCELEDAAGCSAMAFLSRLEESAQGDLSFGDVRLLFWAGLQEHHEGLTVREAGSLMAKLGGIDKALELAGKSVEGSMPKPEGGGGAGKGKKTKGTS